MSHLWSRSFGDGQPQVVRAIAVDRAGEIVVAGEFQGAVDLGGGALATAGGYDIFLARLSP